MKLNTTFIVTCEHASHSIPRKYQEKLNIPTRILFTHRAYDIGASAIAGFLSRYLKAPLWKGRVSRLLVDLNRRLKNRAIFSQYSSQLSSRLKENIVKTYYMPYRREILKHVRREINKGQVVIHLSIHSFAPNLNGKNRKVDVGLLFDPVRPLEKKWCQHFRSNLRSHNPQWRIQFNQPYKGISDGLTSFLREEFPMSQYVGIEIEFNQMLSKKNPAFLAQCLFRFTAPISMGIHRVSR